MKMLEIDCCWDCKHEMARVCTHPHFGEAGEVITTHRDTIAPFCPLEDAEKPDCEACNRWLAEKARYCANCGKPCR